MELSQIRYFLDTAMTQHVTKSAERLHISQPALTKSIRSLEEELGVPLFTRSGRNIILTQYGIFLRDRLKPLISSLDNLTHELAVMTETENHTLRLCVSAASTIVTEAIIEYKKLNPTVNFHVLQNREKELYDIEISTDIIREESCCDSDYICTENIYLAVPKDGKYADRSSISLAEVRDEGFISLFGSKQLRSICDGFCRIAGFEPNVIFESDSPDAVKNMIASNIGIGFWPEFTWGRLHNENVKLLPVTDRDCRRDIIISYKNIKSDSTYAKDFFDFLKKYFEIKNSHHI